MLFLNLLKKQLFGLGILAIFLAGCPQSSKDEATSISGEEAPQIGYFAPNFRLPAMDREDISLASLKGKVVLLNFWATWCGPCRAEMPSMEALYKEFKGRKFEILAISSDIDGERPVRPFVEALGLTYPILFDADFRVDNKYLIRSVPTSLIVDKSGVITHRIQGSLNWNSPEMRELVRQLIEE
ncbi:MAG TPA: TlpA disulfide reductase family protein [Nitrospiria bacterium]|nr:TlpA disulfide reductase family protein [Nitrospiria bacterium]